MEKNRVHVVLIKKINKNRRIEKYDQRKEGKVKIKVKMKKKHGNEKKKKNRRKETKENKHAKKNYKNR